MAIELGPTTAAPKPASTADAKNDQEKSVGSEQSDASGSGGFMAILVAIDTSAAGPALAGDSLQGGALPAPDVNADVPLDAAALLAQSLQWVPPPSEEQATEQTTAGKGTALATSGGNPMAAGKAPARPLADPDAALQQNLAAGVGTQNMRRAAKGQADAASGQAAFSATLNASAATSGKTDAQTLLAAQKTEGTLTAPTAVETTLVAATAAPRREDQGHERSIFKMAAAEGPLTPQAVVTAPSPGTTALGTPAAVSPSEVYVAEQVKYWVSSDVQKAEMTLDGIGNHPVEVSISMQGNEAHVAFRSDELQAREALENAGTHLRDMLQSEGLVLSGVSVGTAGTGNSGAQDQERQARAGGRLATVVSSQISPAGAASGSGRTSGRALDLFV